MSIIRGISEDVKISLEWKHKVKTEALDRSPLWQSRKSTLKPIK
jgi:hypothetical protein